MTFPILPRRLSFEDQKGDTQVIDDSQLLGRDELIVILGEPGMGKSTLLGQLDRAEEVRLIQARRLASSIDPRALAQGARIVVIDALDEAPGAKEGDAVDRVLARLEVIGTPRFVLACREADWRSATGPRAIADVYGRLPLECRLLPFDADDARTLLASSFGDDRAGEIVAHFDDRGLADLFGNPQTLTLIEAAARTEDLPNTRVGLFETAIDVIWCEHNPAKQDDALARLGNEAVLDAAGAAFALQILGGKEALARGPASLANPYDLPMAEIGDETIFDVIGSRLFKPLGQERWTYAHRSIGEFLGARWLARKADTPRKRRRLLTLFHHKGLVPASLRGLHAWLARDPALALDVIAHDPMGVIEYGDADEMSDEQAEALLRALIVLELRNPRFKGWGSYRAEALTRPHLKPTVSKLIASKETGFAVRTLLLQVIAASNAVAEFAPELRAIMLDTGCYYAVRNLAGDALATLDRPLVNWPECLEELRQQAIEDSLRLAIELIPDVGFDIVNDQELAHLIGARSGLTLCPVPRGETNTFAGPFYMLERALPDARVEGLLDELAILVRALLNRRDDYLDRAEITDVVFSLAARRVERPDVDPMRLWSWLSPFEGMAGYHRSPVETLSTWFKNNSDARRAIQRHVLLERPGNKDLWSRSWHLDRVVPGLSPNESDVAALLPVLGTPTRPTDAEIERWKSLVQQVPHDGTRGAIVREAALPFAGKRKRLLNWMSKLPEPRVPPWHVRQDRDREKRRLDREKRFEAHREDYAKHVGKVRAGQFGYLHPPAQAYLKLFRDIGDGLPAHERIAEWLGAELQDACFVGFEAFLTAPEPKPTATEIAESHAQSRRWNAEHIIVAALAERLRTGRGFSDLADERIEAGALILRQTRLDDHAQIDGLSESIEEELRSRGGALEGYWRLQVEFQFKQRSTHVDGLYELMRSKPDASLATALAIEWLNTYPNLAGDPEAVMIDRLIASRQYEALRDLTEARRSQQIADQDRVRNWAAVDFLVDFENAKVRLADVGTRDPACLWQLRRRLSNERDEDQPNLGLGPAQLAWIVREFRSAWPQKHRPTGSSTGDTNVWDASEFITLIVSRLGEMTSEEAVNELHLLKAAPVDGYSDAIAIVAAEQAQKRVEEQFEPAAPATIQAVLADAPPATVADLRAIILEELAHLKARLHGNDTDSWTQFWDGGAPLLENRARDRVIDLLGPNLPFGITAAPEVAMPAGTRADIGFSYGDLRLPVEVKRHWHRDLWGAADTQLDRLYGRDHRASGIGIFLVLWFGVAADRRLPRRPDDCRQPAGAPELEAALSESSVAAGSERVTVVVLDVTRRRP